MTAPATTLSNAPPPVAGSRRPIVARHPAGRRGGFTYVELLMGLAVMALVSGAVAGLLFTFARHWEDADQSSGVQQVAAQGARRLELLLRQGRGVLLARAGSVAGTTTPAGAVLYWANDNASPHGQAQLSELILIQHDPATQTLYLYQAAFPAAWNASQVAAVNATYSNAALTAAGAPETFKANPYVVATPLLGNVKGARFTLQNGGLATQRPSVDYVLNLYRPPSGASSSAATSLLQYGTVTLRGPTQPPG